jgi:hypothetical protein
MGGFDPVLATRAAGGVNYSGPVERAYQRETAEESRAALLPFFWDVIAKKGQVFGDRGVKHIGRVTNPIRMSYPGYSEMLCGHVEERIRNNAPVPNPNVTVLEWLHSRPGFKGKVAAYGAWDRLREIVNERRCGFPVVAGWSPITPFNGAELSERERALNDVLAHATRLWPDEPPDAVTMAAAMECFTRHRPRVFYVMLGEADEWAHGRRYDLYLEATTRADEFVRRLWETAQRTDQYAGKTALIVTTDHGRGSTPLDWTDHGRSTPGADGWWAGVMGPGVEAKGVLREGEATQSQVAATLAGLLGEDWVAAEPRAARGLLAGAKR